MRKIILFAILGLALFGMYRLMSQLAPLQIKDAEVEGTLKTEEPPEMAAMINNFFEKKFEKDQFKCVHYFYGHDDKYAYIQRYCGIYQLDGERIKMERGHSVDTRVEFSKGLEAIESYNEPRTKSPTAADMKRVFPESIKSQVDSVDRKQKIDVVFEKLKEKLSSPETLGGTAPLKSVSSENQNSRTSGEGQPAGSTTLGVSDSRSSEDALKKNSPREEPGMENPELQVNPDHSLDSEDEFLKMEKSSRPSEENN